MSQLELNLQRGLVGHWTLDAGATSNGTAYDSSAYDNNGSILGSYTTGNTSPLGESVYFNGTSGSRMDSSESITIGQSNWTVSSWVYPYSFNEYLHILSEPNQGDFSCKVATGAGGNPEGRPYFYSTDDRTNSSEGESLNSNEWNHVVYRYNGDEIAIFKNGEQTVSNTGNTLNIPTQTYRIQGGNDEYQEAKHSDTRLYLRALSESEINALYNMRSQRNANI